MRLLITTMLLLISTFGHAAPVTIDFEEVTPVYLPALQISNFESKGYTFDTFSVFANVLTGNGVSPSTGIYSSGDCSAWGPGCSFGIRMERIDGGAFAIHSFDATGSTAGAGYNGTVIGGAFANLTVPVGTGDWLQLQTFYADNDSGYMGYVYLDDIVVSAVPVPAAAWLFASGLGLLGWLRRRRVG